MSRSREIESTCIFSAWSSNLTRHNTILAVFVVFDHFLSVSTRFNSVSSNNAHITPVCHAFLCYISLHRCSALDNVQNHSIFGTCGAVGTFRHFPTATDLPTPPNLHNTLPTHRQTVPQKGFVQNGTDVVKTTHMLEIVAHSFFAPLPFKTTVSGKLAEAFRLATPSYSPYGMYMFEYVPKVWGPIYSSFLQTVRFCVFFLVLHIFQLLLEICAHSRHIH